MSSSIKRVQIQNDRIVALPSQPCSRTPHLQIAAPASAAHGWSLACHWFDLTISTCQRPSGQEWSHLRNSKDLKQVLLLPMDIIGIHWMCLVEVEEIWRICPWTHSQLPTETFDCPIKTIVGPHETGTQNSTPLPNEFSYMYGLDTYAAYLDWNIRSCVVRGKFR